MPSAPWRPASEAEAASTRTAFFEWLRAVRGIALADPAGLIAWRRDHPTIFAAAIMDFAGLALPEITCLAHENEPSDGGSYATLWDGLHPRSCDSDERDVIRAALLHGDDDRIALEARDGCWSRMELRHAATLPAPVDVMLAAMTTADLPALAASHLLDVETRPDTRLVWQGDPADPWPLGAWLAGATLVLDASRAGAGTVCRASPPGWRD